MGRITIWIAATMLVVPALAHGASKETSTFRGGIADRQCALNVHSLTRSHQEMLKAKSMGGTPLSCAVYCFRYMEELMQKFVTQKVKIFGTLDQKADTIHVEKIDVDE